MPSQDPQAHAETKAADGAGGSATERVWKWVRRATVVGILVSLTVHLLTAVIAALVLIGGAGSGEAQGGEAVVDFAVTTDAELAALQADAVTFDAPQAPESEQLPEIELAESMPEIDASGSLDALADLAEDLGSGDIGMGEGLGAGGAEGRGASFFGVEASGNRFAYVLDISGSMALGGKMEALRRELNRSLSDLYDAADFLVVLYSDTAMPLDGRARWVNASPSEKRRARAAVGQVNPTGGTNPSPAFELVLQLRPRPDAVYFLTDGEFDASVADVIAQLNGGTHVPIHCIALVNSGAEPLMRRIAQESGGSYTHVPAAGGGP